MSLNNPLRPVLPVANNDTSTYYVSLQPVTCGTTSAKFVSANLTFQPSTQTLSVNKSPVIYSNTKSIFNITTSTTAPQFPKVGDIWYDTTTDIQFEYIFDGTNYQWVDTSSPIIPGKVEYIDHRTVGVANANIVYALANTVNNWSNAISFSVNTVNFADGTVIYWKDIGTANNYNLANARFKDLSNSGSILLNNDANTNFLTRVGRDDCGVYQGNTTFLQLGFYTCASFNNFIGSSNAVPIIDNSPARLIVSPFPVQYLLVGGGGGGNGYNAGGGGGGGGRFLPGSATLNAGGCYSITVGGGGTYFSPGPTVYVAPSGGPTIISSPNVPTFGTFTAVGGGGGGAGSTAASPTSTYSNAGSPGASGGGSGGASPASPVFPGVGHPVTANLGGTATGGGQAGGTGGAGLPSTTVTISSGGGGGGGNGGVGGNGTGAPTPFPNGTPWGGVVGGSGGAGSIWPYTGPTVFYAAGGAGGGGFGPGGAGLNGNPGSCVGGVGLTPGVNGSGSGGGGGSPTFRSPSPSTGVTGSSGGSGTVIFAVPTPNFPAITAPGATISTPPAAPGFTLITYKTSCGTTPQAFTMSVATTVKQP
jgi:hypothetical protein